MNYHPVIKKPKGYWHVYFMYDGKPVRLTGNVNRIKDVKERDIAIQAFLEAVKSNLRQGLKIVNGKFVGESSDVMSLEKALDWGLEKRKSKISSKTYKDYKSGLKYVKLSITAKGLNMPVNEVKRRDMKSVYEHYATKVSASRYNKVIGYIHAIFSELVEWDIIEDNPVHKILPLPVGERGDRPRPTDKEQTKITEHLKVRDYNYYRYVAGLYHTLARPKELLALQVKDFDRDLRYFTIVPDLEEENSKTKVKRHVPINTYFRELLQEMDIFSYPAKFYVFGTDQPSEYRGSRVSFVPREYRLTRKYASDRWLKYVKGELKINKDMYSEKHKSIDDKILDEVELDYIKQLAGHYSSSMTEKYASKLKEVAGRKLDEKARKF